MEWRSNLKRSESLKDVTCDKPIWTDVGLRDKSASVSQLVARYQVGVSQHIKQQTTTTISVEVKAREDPIQAWRPHLQETDLRDTVDSTKESDEQWENGAWNEPKSPTSLSRSKSLSSLPHSAGSIHSLMAKFEPKAAAQNKKATFKSAPRKSDITQMSNREPEKRKKVEDGLEVSVDAPVKEVATNTKQTGSNGKVENNTPIQRRKTVGGIDFEKLAATQAEEKRRSIADFRDSSEKLCISVKAISALYLSKVAPQEPKTQVQSELGTRPRLAKMAQDAKDDIFPLALEGDQSGYQERVAIGTMQQRRRKNELKRLLKHTHPEITMLDKVVEKELAAEEAAAETGYEGEVFSKCLIFETCTTNKKESCCTTNMAQQTEKKGPTPTVLEEPVTPSDPNKEFIDEDVRIDVQSTRRMFEEQSMKTTQSCQSKPKETVFNGDKAQLNQSNQTKSITQAQIESKQKTSDNDFTYLERLEDFDEDFASIPEPETFGEAIKTSIDLIRHNPFITVNVEKEQSCFQSGTECISEGDIPNVRNRKQLFESMPFDKIKQQNKDDLETMVENIKETLCFLYSVNMLQSKGSIIEVHETMKATKAKFILTETGPEIMYDSVAEAGAQNLILQLLPRSNIQPQIKYLKEDNHGAVKAMTVNAPVYHPHSDTEFKTANVVQLIEDILKQDNSLRKGVLILDEVDHCAQVSVYSLYHYIDIEDIKSFYPLQQSPAEEAEPETSQTIQKEIPQLSRGIIKSAIHCLQETQTEICTASVRTDTTIKGNVKLFKSCIEKGDMEYLKSLQTGAELAEEEPPLTTVGQNTTQQSDNTSDSEYEPVDIQRLKRLFTANSIQTEPKPETCKRVPWSATRSEEKCKMATDNKAQDKQHSGLPEAVMSCVPGEDEDSIHQAALVEVLDECDEIYNLQAAISQLQKATVEAKSIHDSLQERQENHRANQTAFENTNTSSTPLKTNEDICKVKSELCAVQSPDFETNAEEEELVLEGKLQAALQALERSNINVSRGGFEAAMLYRNSNKVSSSTKVLSHATAFQDAGSCADVPVERNAERESKESDHDSVIETPIKPQRAKPALPPKPEHLKANTKESLKANGAKGKIQNTEKTYPDPTKKKKAPNNKKEVTNGEISVKLANDPVEISVTSQSTNREKTITENQVVNVLPEQKKDNEEADESHVNFHEACQMFGGKKTAMKKTAPVKPKRVKIAAADTQNQDQSNSSGTRLKEGEAKVNMRVKKVHKETEDERRQRLSVHMDEIMKGNITAAMEIFDNLRKQEELENILIRVEEIEQDTSEVDVKSLRKVFEDVPEWVVSSDKKKVKVQQKEESPNLVRPNTENRTPIAHVFGDLARASEEIIHLKEQTLARLLDIEEAIKKALYSVSNLKSESDIAGLSSLFKESLGGESTVNTSGNIRTISIGSSRTKAQDNAVKTKSQSGEVGSPKQPSPTSSPAFISIQSAARKADHPEITLCPSCQNAPKPEEKFRTTKTVQCNSPAQVRKGDPRRGGQKQSPSKPKRELSMLEVQTDTKGTQKKGAKTVTENYERMDNFGNKFYSTKTSTVVTTEPQMTMPCPVQTAVSPAVHQISTYTRLPVNKKL